ncbi:MAG: HEPN domain-containing protein [Cyanobacteriota bacterium]
MLGSSVDRRAPPWTASADGGQAPQSRNEPFRINRSADWLNQARADLELAGVSAAAGHHEWACFACHQAVEKAFKGLHLHHGQQVWGHGLGRSYRDLPSPVSAALAAAVSDLEDRLRILVALYIPTRSPHSLPDGAPTDHFGRLQSDDALRHARSMVCNGWACLAATAAAMLAWAAIWTCC